MPIDQVVFDLGWNAIDCIQHLQHSFDGFERNQELWESSQDDSMCNAWHFATIVNDFENVKSRLYKNCQTPKFPVRYASLCATSYLELVLSIGSFAFDSAFDALMQRYTSRKKPRKAMRLRKEKVLKFESEWWDQNPSVSFFEKFLKSVQGKKGLFPAYRDEKGANEWNLLCSFASQIDFMPAKDWAKKFVKSGDCLYLLTCLAIESESVKPTDSISHNDVKVTGTTVARDGFQQTSKLSPMQLNLFQFVHNGGKDGRNRKDVFEHLYRGRAVQPKSLDILRYETNNKLNAVRLSITSANQKMQIVSTVSKR